MTGRAGGGVGTGRRAGGDALFNSEIRGVRWISVVLMTPRDADTAVRAIFPNISVARIVA